MKLKFILTVLCGLSLLLTFCFTAQAQPDYDNLPIYASATIGTTTLEVRTAQKNTVLPDLCSGSISANPTSGYTAFEVSSQATVTVTYNYEYCGGPSQPPCCTNNPANCGNEFGWGTDPDPGITYPLGSWQNCDPSTVNSYSPKEILFCFQPNTTYYFKVYVTPTVYNCPNTYVTLSADCNYPSNQCP